MSREYIVYCHTSPSGKKYIGLTSQTPAMRYGSNGKNYKECPKFFNAIKKYGWNNIHHEVLFSNLTFEEAERMERLLIFMLKTTETAYGYNLDSGGVSGRRLTEETKRKMSIAKLNMSEETKRKMIENRHFRAKPVDQYSMDGEYIRSFNTVTEAGKSLGKGKTNISDCACGRLRQAYGYIWKFKEA